MTTISRASNFSLNRSSPVSPVFAFVSFVCFVVNQTMSSELQTIIALALVCLAAAWLLRGWFGRRKNSSSCAGSCGAVSGEVKKLRARLKR